MQTISIVSNNKYGGGEGSFFIIDIFRTDEYNRQWL